MSARPGSVSGRDVEAREKARRYRPTMISGFHWSANTKQAQQHPRAVSTAATGLMLGRMPGSTRSVPDAWTIDAGWNRATLSAELGELAVLLPECNLNIDITGFEAPEFDALMGDLVDPEQDPADELSEIAKINRPRYLERLRG